MLQNGVALWQQELELQRRIYYTQTGPGSDHMAGCGQGSLVGPYSEDIFRHGDCPGEAVLKQEPELGKWQLSSLLAA